MSPTVSIVEAKTSRPISQNTSAVEDTIESLPASQRDLELESPVPTENGEIGCTNLPRADGGKDAWLFLAGCFVLEGIVWGFPFAFGVFESYYTSHLPFSEHPSGISVIGTCGSGVMYLFAPITLYILSAYPSIRNISSILGLAIIISALILASFSSKVYHLIITQGILSAIGGSFLYTPSMFYLDQWFIKRKGFAFGVMWSGAGISGLIFPFLLSFLLESYGFRTTLRVWAILLLVLCAPLIYFIRPRVPPSNTLAPKPSYSFLKTRTAIFLSLSNICQSLAYFLPSVYLPTYITTLSPPLSSLSGTLFVALLNTSSVVGCIVLGHLSDTFHISLIISLSAITSALAVLLLWGLSPSLSGLVIFVLIYGTMAGGYSSLWAGMLKEIQKVDAHAGMGASMGVFAAGRGVGAISSGGVAELLLRKDAAGVVGRGPGFRGGYRDVIIFTGVSMLSGLWCLGVKRKSGN
ncbi:hypothetical protein B7494_g4177 [Chlorociboria aeruginascens]|nr:hypothetical protein B7494_g4177 [Chlorociboria aeruginascens]